MKRETEEYRYHVITGNYEDLVTPDTTVKKKIKKDSYFSDEEVSE